MKPNLRNIYHKCTSCSKMVKSDTKADIKSLLCGDCLNKMKVLAKVKGVKIDVNR